MDSRVLRRKDGTFAGRLPGPGSDQAVPTPSAVPSAPRPSSEPALDSGTAVTQRAVRFQHIVQHTRVNVLGPGGPGAVLTPNIQWFHDRDGERVNGEILARPPKGINAEDFYNMLTVPEHIAIVEWETRIAAEIGEQSGGRIGVNVSNDVANDPEARKELIRIASEAQYPICFEFTEQTPLPDPKTMNALLAELHSLGHETALDDFGTGFHTDPAILDQYNFRTVKLARQAVLAIFASSSPDSALRAFRRATEKRGQEVVVEGADTPDMVARLRAAGFTTFQCFLYHRPEAIPANITH